MSDLIHKRLGEFIQQELMGCNFVGIGDDKEVFVSFDHEDIEIEKAAKKKIKDHFEEEIAGITTIVQTSISELQQLIDNLNKALAEVEREEKGPLLDIGNF